MPRRKTKTVSSKRKPKPKRAAEPNLRAPGPPKAPQTPQGPPTQVALSQDEMLQVKSVALELENLQLKLESLSQQRATVLQERARVLGTIAQRNNIDRVEFYTFDPEVGMLVRKNDAAIKEVKQRIAEAAAST